MNGEKIRSGHEQTGSLVEQGFLELFACLVILSDAAERKVARRDVEARDFCPVDPDDAAIIHADAQQERRRHLPAHDEGVPEKERRVAALHVGENGVVVAVLVADGCAAILP